MNWRAAVPAGSDRAVLAAAALGWLVLLAAPPALDLPALCGRAAALVADPAAWALLAAFASPSALAAGWIAMAAAMMLPLAAPQLRHVIARAGPFAPLAAASFLAAWLAVWLTALAAIELAGALAASAFGREAPIVAVIFAVGWQHTPAKRRALRRCVACPPLPWQPGALVIACARLGLATGGRCVTGCWALMLAAMSVMPAVPAMLAAATVIWVERYVRRAPLAFEAPAGPLRGR
ncbi:MAG: DUF2182 domain-containing protein [Novosphingobium sp.]